MNLIGPFVFVYNYYDRVRVRGQYHIKKGKIILISILSIKWELAYLLFNYTYAGEEPSVKRKKTASMEAANNQPEGSCFIQKKFLG